MYDPVESVQHSCSTKVSLICSKETQLRASLPVVICATSCTDFSSARWSHWFRRWTSIRKSKSLEWEAKCENVVAAVLVRAGGLLGLSLISFVETFPEPPLLVCSATTQSCVVELLMSAQKCDTIVCAICNKFLLPSTVGVTKVTR